jgi:hypothetical protein
MNIIHYYILYKKLFYRTVFKLEHGVWGMECSSLSTEDLKNISIRAIL